MEEDYGRTTEADALDVAGTQPAGQNYKCDACGDVFAKHQQIMPHIVRKHGRPTTEWTRTSEPINRQMADWKVRLAVKAVNETLVGPFKCLHCDHPPCDTIRGVTAHIGHIHKKDEQPRKPSIAGVDFEALGTGVTPKGKPKRQYTKRADVPVKEAIIHIMEIPLNENIIIRVPLLLGPPTFAERNGNGKT